jgi:hypothetical protein
MRFAMTRGGFNVVLLAGLSITVALGASQRTPSLVLDSPQDTTSELASLEARVARSPEDREAALRLARALLGRNAPGLALAVLERSSRALERSPEAADLAATAQMKVGKNRAALASTKQALVACERQGCEGTLLARNARREELIEAALAEGIEDMEADPEATARAHRKATRRVQLAMN